VGATAWLGRLSALSVVLWALPAGAQQPAEAPAPAPADELVFNFDELLVGTLQPEGQATEADADRVHRLLVERFAKNNPLIAMSDVPRFEVQDYGADVYLRACPAGQYGDCALVVGQRTEAVWVVGGTVDRLPDDRAPDTFFDRLTLFFVDVPNATIVATFTLVLDGTDDAAVIDGVARAYDDMVQGEYDDRDVRGDLGDPEAEAALQKARADRIAASLADLEEQLGDVVRGEVVRGQRKLTKEELDAYDDREELAPWERVGMKKGEYLRFANSGKTLAQWRRESNGRMGQLIARAGFGGGSGPYSQGYASQVLLSGSNLQPIHQVQLSEVRRGGTGVVDLELGVGVAPWVEVMFAAGFRTGQVELSTAEYKQGDFFQPARESSQALNTSQIGVRAAFAPGLHWPARPTLGLGFASWSGVSVEGSPRLAALPKPKATFLELLPGAEVTASPTISLFARGLVALPVGSAKAQREEIGGDYDPATTSEWPEGQRRLESPPQAGGEAGLGASVQVGLTLRFGPLWSVDSSVKSRIDTDDEPDF
jgi:hypothetical protein